MHAYESPSITELGSVADMTRGDGNHFEFDGFSFITIFGHQIPVGIDLSGPGPSTS